MNSTPDAAAEARMDGLDRRHGTAGTYRRLDHATVKGMARTAFLAYSSALIAGDTELAEAAKLRFLDASQTLARKRGAS